MSKGIKASVNKIVVMTKFLTSIEKKMRQNYIKFIPEQYITNIMSLRMYIVIL